MVICKTYNNEVLWLHSNDAVKDLDEFKDNENVFIIDKYVEFKIKPDDGNIYKQMWNEDEQDIYLLKVGPKPLTLEEKIDNINGQTRQANEDIVTTIELHMDTNEKVETACDDNLMSIELLLAIDDKLNQLLGRKA